MYQSRGVPWIGFQEAQKAIDALKEEVNLAEKKLSNAKRSLKSSHKLSTPVAVEKLPSEVKKSTQEISHFHKETVPKELHNQEKSSKRLKTAVSKTVEVKEHSKGALSHVPQAKPFNMKETLVKTVYESSLTKTSSGTSSSLLDINNFVTPSEVSLSSLGDIYKCVDAELSLRITRQENIENKDPSDISFNSWEKEYLKRINSSDGDGMNTTLSPHPESSGDIFWAPVHSAGDVPKKRGTKLKKIAQPSSTSDQHINQYVQQPIKVSNEMEWRSVSSGEKFPSSKPKNKSSSYLALKGIIERQKKFHEEIQSRSNTEFQSISTTEPHAKPQEVKKITSVDIQAELQMKPPPVRKKCHVSTLPQYRGFSVPGVSAVSNRKSRPIKKATRYISEIKRADNLEKVEKNQDLKIEPSFKVKEIVIENNVELPESIAPDQHEKDKPFPDSSSSEKTSNSSEPPTQEKQDHLTERAITPEKEISPVSNSPAEESYSEKFLTSSESPLKSRLLSNEVSLQRDKPSKLPVFSKSTKRKAVEERTAPSPKIRHYDVNEVRDYIKQKKEERKKRHQEERKKTVEEVQRKKESLLRLFEYQKAASVPTFKNTSPLKASRPSENVQKYVSSKRLCTDTESLSLNFAESLVLPGAAIKSSRKTFVPEPSHSSDTLQKKPVSNGTALLESQKAKHESANYVKKNARSEEKGLQTELTEPNQTSNELRSQDLHLKFTVSKNQETQTRAGLLNSNSYSLSTLPTSSAKAPPHPSDNQSLNMPSFISTISTPSQFSLSSNINAELPEELKFKKFTIPSIAEKLEQAATLKNLAQSINHITAPFENIMRTKAWVERSPPPPKRKSPTKIKPSQEETLPKRISGDGKDSTDFVIQVAKSLYRADEKSSFKQQVTNVGDTSELFQKILGPQTHARNQTPTSSPLKDMQHVSVASNDNLSLVEGPIHSENDTLASEKYPSILDNYSVIEGSLSSEDQTVLSRRNRSEHPTMLDEKVVSILSAPTTNPDPFNFINTWNRKPLGFYEASSKRDTPFTTLMSDSKLLLKSNENKNHTSGTFSGTSVRSSTEYESMSLATDEPSKQESIESSESRTEDNSIIKGSSQDKTIEGSTSEESVISSHIDRRRESNDVDNYSNDNNQSQNSDNKKPLSLSESSLSENISVIENSKSKSKSSHKLSNVSEKLNDISFNKSEPNVIDSTQNPISFVEESVKEKSEMEYEEEDSKSEESIPDLSGLVEEGSLNSSGNESVRSIGNYTEVQENLKSSKSNETKMETVPSENSFKVDGKRNSSGTKSSVQEINGDTSPVDIFLEKGVDHENDPAEKMKMLHKSISLHKKEYLHTQVKKEELFQEAAAAAAAFLAVFETQKELPYHERNLPSSSTFLSSSQSSPQFETLSEKATDSSSSTSKKTSPANSEEIIEDIADNNSPISNVKEALSSTKDSSIKSASLHSSKPKSESTKKLSRSRKTSGNISSPSPASLSENESLSHSIEMIASSVASSSTLDESILSDDSFTQLTLEVVRKKTLEEELRASHKLAYLKFQEKSLVENARAEMAWFESLKKKLREKGSNKKASFIKRKQKELILRLRQERAQLRCMQEAYRSMCEKHQLLDDPNLLVSLSSKRKDKSLDSKNTSDTKVKDLSRPESMSTSTIVTADDDSKVMDEEYPDTVLEMPKSIASVSSQGSVVETIVSEQAKSSESSLSKSLKASSSSIPPTKQGLNQSNVSLTSVNSAESFVQGFKKLESSKRHLTKREQRILQRRKHVERLLQWQMKLDSEEMAVRELEQKAVELVDSSKKRTKYYVSTSPSTVQNESEKQSVAESPETESKVSESLNSDVSTDRTPSTVKSEILPESSPTNSIPEENSIPATSSNSVEEMLSNKESNDPESSAVSTNSIKEVESNQSESPVKTADDNTESSNAEEVITNGGTYPSTKSGDQKSPSSDMYSESFESTASPKVFNNNSSTIRTPPSSGSKKEKSFSIKSPLGPRNFRRHDSSGSDDSYTISHSETASDQSDIEVRIHVLSEELRRRKQEAEKLKREQKRKYREHLKGKELSLQKQVEAYNQYIQQVKLELEKIEAISSVPLVETSPVKPQIKWPRSEQAGESRRIRKQSSISAETFSEKKSEGIATSPDSIECHIDISHKKEKIIMKNLFPETKEKPNFQTEAVPETEKHFPRRDSSSSSSKITSIVSASSSDKEITENIGTGTIPDTQLKSSFEKTPSETSVKSKEETEIEESFETPRSSIDTISSCNEIEEVASDSRRKSSYPSESFASNSSTSQSSDNSTVQKPTVHTITSDENESRDSSLESVEEMHDSDASINTALNESGHSSEPDYTPESSLVTNTGSVKDDFGSGDFESSDHSSNTVPPKPIESAAVENLSKVPPSSETNKLVSESSLAILPAEKHLTKKTDKYSLKEKLKSETFVVNVVHYLYSSVFDDAIKTVLSLSRKDVIGVKHLKTSDLQDITNKSSCLKGKLDNNLADKISNTLLDSFLDEAICSIINIANTFKKYPAAENESKVPITKNTSDTPIFSNEDFSVNYSVVTSHDKNDNIFGKQADWFDDSVLGNQWDSQPLEQQLLLQHYPYFYRKIPNKPPPPYTPPSSPSVSSMLPLPLRKDRPVERFDTIELVTKNLKAVVEHITDILMSAMERGVRISEMTEPDLDIIVQKLGLTTPCQLTFFDLIFDLSKETSLNLFCETEEVVEPWLKPRKLTPKPLFPKEKSKLSAALYKELHHTLRLQPKDSSLARWKKPSWSTMKLGRKKRDFVDTILISELKEEELDWVNYDQEEVTVKFQIADYIFDILVDDTAALIQKLDQSIFK